MGFRWRFETWLQTYSVVWAEQGGGGGAAGIHFQRASRSFLDRRELGDYLKAYTLLLIIAMARLHTDFELYPPKQA